MNYRELSVELRQDLGSGAVQRLRKAGYVPAVVYADGNEAKAISVSTQEFMLLGRRSVPTQLFKFKSSDSSLDGQIALVKEVQTEPLKGALLHLDFLAISEGHRINVEIPLKLIGEVAAVKEGRAMVNQSAYEIEVECLPSEIPEQIIVEIGHMREGQSIHAAQLTLPPGAVLRSNPELTVVSIVVAKKEETAAAPAVEGAEAETQAAPAEKEDEK